MTMTLRISDEDSKLIKVFAKLHGISASDALMAALSGKLPEFMQIELADLPELWSPPDSEEEASPASEVEEAA